MRSADKVSFVYTVYRANLDTFSASRAEGIVYYSKIILYGNSAVRTGFLTLHTTDTAVGAIFACKCALVVIRALNHYTGGVVYEADYTVGTFSYTDSASDTLLGIDSCNAVLHGYSVLRANRNAVTVAEACIVAESVTTVRQVGCKTGFVSLIIVLLFVNVTRAVAGNESHLFNNVLCGNAEDFCDFLGRTVAAGNTQISFISRFFGKSLCVSVTSGIAASSAVCARQAISDSYCGFIFLNLE